MIKSEKQARLSAALLSGKKSSISPAQAGAADVAEQPGDAGDVAVAERAALPETLLFSKGAASAAGFRPSYWSYVPQESPAQMPEARPEAMLQHRPRQNRAMIGIRGWKWIAQLSLIACVGLALVLWINNPVSRIKPPAPVPAVAAPSPSPVAAVAAPAPPAVTAAPAPPLPPVAPAVAVAPKNVPPPQPNAALLAEWREIETLLNRGDELLGTGDVASARLFYERAAAKGDGRAALLVGETFDPVYLRRMGVFGGGGDPAQAAQWYRRARDLGDASAESRLSGLNVK
jgi:hypothetical protein